MCVEKMNGRSFLNGLCVDSVPYCAFNENDDFGIWREDTKKKLEELLCLSKLSVSEYRAVKKESVKEIYNGAVYTRQLWDIDTLKDLVMPVYVLIPENGSKKAAIAVHCHGSDGKNGLAGIDVEGIEENFLKLDFRYALELLEKGYTVFCPDMLGSGSRKPIKHDKVLKSDCDVINFSLMALGLNLQGVIISELKRCIDFIEKFEDTDASELMCVGFSSGGLNTMWLAALDERIKTAYISGYFHSFKQTLLQSNFCGCNFIQDLWKTVDMDALAMLIAPRRLYVETGNADKLNGRGGLEKVYDLVENTKKIYKDIYKSDNFKFKVCDGAHKWYGEFINEL